MEKFDFTMTIPEKNRLPEEELRFFYYDILPDNEDAIQYVYEWNDSVKEFLQNKGIIIDNVSKEEMPQDYVKDTLYFTIGDNESKTVAFFRHLRNAFAHLRISRIGEYLYLKDSHNGISMIGQLKFEDLKEFCFLFFDQRTEFWDKYDSYNDYIP